MRIVAIAGLSCSGKTTLAHLFSERLNAPVLSLDDYYDPLSAFTLEERKRRNFDSPDIFDWELLLSHLLELKAGRSIHVPLYDFVEFTRSGERCRIEPPADIILEGQYALFHPDINQLATQRIFLEVDPQICLERRIRRDVEQRGRDPFEVQSRFERDVLPMYERYIAPTRTNATLTITNNEPLCRQTLLSHVFLG